MSNTFTEVTTQKLYKTKSITLATFFGGPLAARYLIGENFNTLNEHDKDLKAKIIGAIATILLFTVIFSVPEKIMSKIPNSIIPIVYTGLIWGYVEWSQGEFVKRHEKWKFIFLWLESRRNWFNLVINNFCRYFRLYLYRL